MPNLERLYLDAISDYLDLEGRDEILASITSSGSFMRVGFDKGYQITPNRVIQEINAPQH